MDDADRTMTKDEAIRAITELFALARARPVALGGKSAFLHTRVAEAVAAGGMAWVVDLNGGKVAADWLAPRSALPDPINTLIRRIDQVLREEADLIRLLG